MLSIREINAELNKKKSLYDILEIKKTASVTEIKQVYRRLALKYHPDKNSNHIEECQEIFKKIQHAYSILVDEKKRQQYDAVLNDQIAERTFSQFSYSNFTVSVDEFSINLVQSHQAIVAAEPNKSSYVAHWDQGFEDIHDPFTPIFSESKLGHIFIVLGKPVRISESSAKFRKNIPDIELRAAFSEQEKFVLVYSDYDAKKYCRATRVGNFYQDPFSAQCPMMKVRLIKTINQVPVQRFQVFISERYHETSHTSAQSIYYIEVDKTFFEPLAVRLHVETCLGDKSYPDIPLTQGYAWRQTYGLFGTGARPVLDAKCLANDLTSHTNLLQK